MALPTTNELRELLPYLTPQERAELDSLLAVEGKERPPEYDDFTAFKFAIYKRYQHPDHLALLDAELRNVVDFVESGGKKGVWLLIVEMPPRHGKSLAVSRMLPAWFLGRNPDKRVMLVSYGASLAQKNSRHARAIIASPLFQNIFEGVGLDPGSKAADAWDIAGHEGGCDAFGVLGSATGKGADLLIGDDLVKNRQEAESEVIRERTWEAWNDDLLSRLEPGGGVVLFATRWHMDDPIGRMLKLAQDKGALNGPVKRLRLSALIENEDQAQEDPLGRSVGEPLWADRYPVRILEAIRKREGPYSWSALYQQNPTPAEGGIFKRAWFSPLQLSTPDIVRAVRYWDMAMSEKTSADYTVGVLIGQGADGHFYVLDVARKQIEWGDLVPWIAGVMLQDGPGVAQGLEEKGYMSRAIQELNADPRLHGYEIWGYPVDKDKLTRALPVAAKSAAGLIHVVEGHWTREFLDEVCAFPNGMHDDQVDAFAGAWAMIGDEGSIVGYVTPAANPRAIAAAW